MHCLPLQNALPFIFFCNCVWCRLLRRDWNERDLGAKFSAKYSKRSILFQHSFHFCCARMSSLLVARRIIFLWFWQSLSECNEIRSELHQLRFKLFFFNISALSAMLSNNACGELRRLLYVLPVPENLTERRICCELQI